MPRISGRMTAQPATMAAIAKRRSRSAVMRSLSAAYSEAIGRCASEVGLVDEEDGGFGGGQRAPGGASDRARPCAPG